MDRIEQAQQEQIAELARRLEEAGRQNRAQEQGAGLIPPPLDMLLALARDIARLLRLEHDARLGRIDGGVAPRGPGAELVLRGDHMEFTLWERTEQDLRPVRGHVSWTLGAGFPVSDGRRRLTPAPVTEPAPITAWPARRPRWCSKLRRALTA